MNVAAFLPSFSWGWFRQSRLLGFLFAYCMLAEGSMLLQSDGIGVPVWPAAGVSLGALLLLGTRAWIVPIGHALLAGVGTTVDALFCLLLLRYRFKFNEKYLRLRVACGGNFHSGWRQERRNLK